MNESSLRSSSKDNREVAGEGVFIEALRNELIKNGMYLKIVGIKAFEPEKAIKTIQHLIADD